MQSEKYNIYTDDELYVMYRDYEECGMEERATIPCSPRVRDEYKSLKRGGQIYNDLLIEIVEFLKEKGFNDQRKI